VGFKLILLRCRGYGLVLILDDEKVLSRIAPITWKNIKKWVN